jgi:Ca2+-transporting ATPase
VAKEASDMVLMDDDFSSVVKAVEEGRVIYDNIKKFVNYLLSSNLGEVMVLLMAALFGWPLPLLALQILWINLITDGLPALALGVDPGNPGVMKAKPRRITDKIMNRRMNFNVAFMGVLIASGTLFMFHLYKDADIRLARTIAFTTLVVLEIVRVQLIRMSHNERFFSNPWLTGALIFSLALQLAVIYTPLSRLFHTAPLEIGHWAYIAVTGAALILLGRVISSVFGLFQVRWS